ncbi:DUF3426 domain-containing protein [Chitinibacter sp. FCG-7]|uniref:DUF3426 domain-containing protein n=1 Tax=Chitinibacter mangrovi TaxID=3153927 RepID=A0AAU7FDE0_9NEIS
MTQITRCPNCSTSFRVTDDQLAAHQGKVRCGRCSFVFNARDFLQRVEKAEATEKAQESIAPQGNTEKPAKAIPIETIIHATQVAPSSAPLNPPQAEPAPAVELATQTTEKPAERKNERDLQRALARLIKKTQRPKTRKVRKPSRHTIAVREENLPSDANTTAALRQPSEIDTEAEYRPILDDSDDLFLPPKRSRWAWLWSLGSLLLLLALLAQLAFNFRLELSQEFPALRSKWQAVCVHLKCEMPLPRQADLLRSEWSELTYIPDHPTLIQVKATLRNLAPFEQALPKLELTLTDENERVVAKKVFLAKEYLAQTEAGQQAILPNDELHAFLQLDLGNLNSTGYSLYWFYD